MSLQLDHIASDGRIVDEWWIGEDLDGSYRSLIYVISWNLLRGAEKSTKKLRIASVLAEIRTEYIPNKNIVYHL
jgi:hypothetical protein